MKLPPLPILSDLDGTLIDSKASVVAAFRWWAESKGLPADTASRIPFGRTSTDAAAVLAPHLDHIKEGALLDERQEQDTDGVIALDGASELLSSHDNLAIVTSCPRRLIFPHDTGHRVKDHIMIQNEVLNEQTTQETQFGI